MNRRFTISILSSALFAACFFTISSVEAGPGMSTLKQTQSKTIHAPQQRISSASKVGESVYALRLKGISNLSAKSTVFYKKAELSSRTVNLHSPAIPLMPYARLLSSGSFASIEHASETTENRVIEQKEAVFILGPVAAGKSTTRKRLYPTYSVIDPDELKSEAWSVLREEYKVDPFATIAILEKTHTLSDYASLLEQDYDESNLDMIRLVHALSKKMSLKVLQDRLTKEDAFIYDTTGTNVEKMKRNMLKAKQRGFKTVLLYVTAPLDVCLKRNAERTRSLPDDVIKEKWYKAQIAWGELKDLSIVDVIKEINTASS